MDHFRPSYPEDQLENALRELKMYRSILEMLKGNTPDETMKNLEQRWLEPLRVKIEELQRPL